MRKSMRKIITAIVYTLCLLLASCGVQSTTETPEAFVESANESVNEESTNVESVKNETSEEEISEEEISETESDTPVQETVIDFPFSYDVEEGCKLTLACMDESAEVYELRFYDKDGNIAQKLSCGQLKEPLRFSYDNLTARDYYYNDLELFSDGAMSGLLFISDRTAVTSGKLFLEEPIEIPLYETAFYDGSFNTSEESETHREEILYQINEEEGRVEPLRRMTLQKETAMLEIWDYLDNRSVFSGEAVIKEDGSLSNAKYYQYLFRNDCYPFYQSSDTDTSIPVWVSQTKNAEDASEENGDQSGFELVQNTVFGNTGHMSEYEDRKTFLSDFGFGEQAPFYCYYDGNGNLQLELYLDEESGWGCGLMHTYGYTYQMEKKDSMYGFAFDAVSDGTWKESDPYLLASVDGETGEKSVDDYEENIDYTETEKVDCYRSLGIVGLHDEEGNVINEKSTIVKINYIYRDDGTLFYRDYYHNDYVFGSTWQSCDSYYDESERIVYETAYITHGSLEYYYIYDNAGREPKYALYLDDNLGYCIPVCVRFH